MSYYVEQEKYKGKNGYAVVRNGNWVKKFRSLGAAQRHAAKLNNAKSKRAPKKAAKKRGFFSFF